MKEARQRIANFITIDMQTGCWNWDGCIQANGYGRVTFQRQTQGAHRLSYKAYVGPIPVGYDVCHHCDNRKCVNPMHLFAGTRNNNMADAVAKGMHARGCSLPITKVSGERLERLLSMVNQGVLYKDIARRFDITPQNVGKIAIKHGVRRYAK